MEYSVAKNTSFLTAASIGQKIISFVYFTVIARLIGVENTGAYFFALTFTNIFAVVADFGFAAVLTREMSKSPEKSNDIFATAFSGKLLFGGAAYLLVVIGVNLLQYPALIRDLIYLAGLTMWTDNLHSLFYAVFRAKRNLKYESFGIVGSQLITLIIGSVALYLRLPLIWLIIAYAVPSFLNVCYSGFFAVRLFGLKLKLALSRIAWREFIAMAWPFALAGIIGRLYSYSDSMLMSKMLTARELGWWSVPYKITFAFQFIPLALSASVYPVFSSLFAVNREEIARLFEKSWRYLFIIVFPLSAGIFAIAEPFITKVYGQNYFPSVLPLRILVISLVFGYLALISGALLNAIGQQKKQTILMACALLISIVANVILIPKLGIIGAAISALIGNFFLWLSGFTLANRYAQLNKMALFSYSLRAIVPAVIMGGAVYLSLPYLSLFLAIPLGGMVYFGLLLLSGGLNRELLAEVKIKIFSR
ncbi:MAG: flippase [Patescibacteria group bacterium]|nr:flippase [Patescibacteria group bacterium]